MLIYAMFSALGGVLIKASSMSAFAITGFRSLIAGSIIVLFYAAQGKKLIMNKKTLISGFILALVLVTFILSNKLTTSANAIMLQYGCPIYIIGINYFIFRKKTNRKDIIAVVVSVCAIPLFFVGRYEAGGLLGNILALLSGMLLAVMFTITSRMSSEEETASAMIIGHIFAVVICLPIAAMAETIIFTGKEVLILLGLGALQQAIPHILYSKAIQLCSVLTCNLVSILETVLNPIYVFAIIGEMPTVFAIIAMVVIIVNTTFYTIKKANC